MSYYTRSGDSLLRMLKADLAAAPEKVYDRAEAARRAWEVRRARFGPGGGNRKGGGAKKNPENYAKPAEQPQAPGQGGPTPADINADLRQALDKVVQRGAMPWAKEKPRGRGINTSGIVNIDGKKYFAKEEAKSEAAVEVGVWNAAQALGWNDMGRPAIAMNNTVLNPLLPDGESLMTYNPSTGDVEARVPSRDVKISKDKLERMMIFEYAIGAYDRHGGNYWWDRATGDVHGIDYARSFMRTFEGAVGQEVGKTGEQNGIWGRSFNKDRKISRRHIQNIVDHEDDLLKAIPEGGGYDTPHSVAVAAMSSRINQLKKVLAREKGEVIDMRQQGGWA